MSEARRLDQWLWFARIVKSRSLAQRAIAAGQVRVNRMKTDKPAREIAAGDVITLAIHGNIRVLRVLGPGKRRGPAAEALRLYEELRLEPAAAVASGEEAC